MTSQGDDCYFYYYSTCAKGEECPFRHQPAALGCEVICEEWEKNGRCLRPVCRFRHMLIEERRSRTQCYWESQPSGCLKPFCPFLHTKPRPNEQSNTSTSVPTISTPAQPLPVPPTPAPPSSAGPQNVRSIPTISSTPRPRQPLHQNVSIGRQPVTPISYPTAPNRLVVAPQPPQMIRTPQYTGPPRLAGIVQPVPVDRGFPPVLPHVPVRFGRGMPAPQRYPHLVNMYMGRPEGSATSFLPKGGFQEDRYDRQDSDSYSSSGSDDERRKSHQTSRRKVRNSSQREVFSSDRRDTRNNRKPGHERYRTGDRRRTDGSKDKNKDSTDAERERSRDRRRPSRRSDKESEEKERKDIIERLKRKKSLSQDEKNEEKEEKEDMAKDENSPGIKVKTLEEILREKALKKLEERRAQAKSEEQKEAEDGKEDEESMGKGEGANNEEEEECSVIESESNTKHLLDEKDYNSVESSSEKPSVARKVSLNDRKRSPVKKLIGLKNNSINSKRSSNADSSSEEVTLTKRVSANSEENENVNEKVTTNEPPSPFQQVRVKSFEEIMQEKRKRKAEQEGPGDSVQDLSGESSGQVNSSTATATATSILTKRLKRLARKSSDDSDKDTKVVSSSAAETDSKVEIRKKRTVYVMDNPSSSKDSKENDVTSTASNGENKPQKASVKKPAVAERLGQQKVRVKSLDEIMAEKRQRASQESVEAPKDKEVAKEEERGLKNSPQRNQQRKPLNRVSVPVIKPRRIKVWAQGTSKLKPTEDSVSSSTVDETQKDHESREQALQSDMESSKLPAFQSEAALAESQLRPADASVEDETPAPDQRIPNKENCAKTTASDGEAGIAPNEFGHCTITVEADESGPKTTKIAPEPEEAHDSPEKPQHSPPEQHDMEDTESSLEYQPVELKASKEPPSLEEIKRAIANEMAKDDFFDEFGADIDFGEHDDVAGDSLELNEDDLLMELDEMINQ